MVETVLRIWENDNQNREVDLSGLLMQAQVQTSFSGQPGKLTATVHRDPRGIMRLPLGSHMALYRAGRGVFYGRLYTAGIDDKGAYKLTCYDAQRALKNSDRVFMTGCSASQFFKTRCTANLIRHRVDAPTRWVVPEKNFTSSTEYAMLDYALQKTNVALGMQHFLWTDWDTVVFDEVARRRSELILAPRLLTGYTFEQSIDKDVYNSVKVTRDRKGATGSGAWDAWVVQDSANIALWGKLQTVVKAGRDDNAAQAQKLARDKLAASNYVAQSLKLEALGADGVVAGVGVGIRLPELGMELSAYVKTVTHSYKPALHTMSLEVVL